MSPTVLETSAPSEGVFSEGVFSEGVFSVDLLSESP
jgi:hypothetical protein